MEIKKTLDHLVGKGSLVLAGAAMLLASCSPWVYTTRANSANHSMKVVVYNSAVDAKPVYLTEKQFAENKPLQDSLYAQAVKANDAYFGIGVEPAEEQVAEETNPEDGTQMEMISADTDLDQIMAEPVLTESATEEKVAPEKAAEEKPAEASNTNEAPAAKVEEKSYNLLQVKWDMQKELVDQHGVPVIIDVTKDGVYFCTDGIGQVLFDANRKPYIDNLLKNGECDPSERIKNYATGGQLFDFAYLKTLQGFDEMETFRKSLLYKPLGEED